MCFRVLGPLAVLLAGCHAAQPQRLTVQTRVLPPIEVGVPYSVRLSATGGTPPYSWEADEGGLPDGLRLSEAGVIDGTAAVPQSSYTAVTVSDAEGATATRVLRLTVRRPGAPGARYVAPDGDDGAPGTRERPWRTVQHAAESAGPGETVYLVPGTYDEEVVVDRSGAAEAPITFAAHPPAEPSAEGATAEALIKGPFILAEGTSYICLDGLTIRGFSVWGVDLTGDNHHIELTNLHVQGGEAGIHLTVGDSGSDPEHGPVSDVLIADCIVNDCLYTAIDGTPGPCNRIVVRRVEVYGAGLTEEDSFGADGIAIERGESILVEDCYVHDNGGDGIDLNSRDTDGHATGIVVRGNVVARNHLNGVKLWAGGRLEGNVLWGQGVNPLDVGVHDCEAQIIRNTIAYNMWDAQFGGRDYASTFGWPEEGTPRVRLTLKGNIWAFNTGPDVGSPTGIFLGEGVDLVEESQNLFYSREDGEITWEALDREFSRGDITGGAWAAASGHGEGDQATDPRFVAGWPQVDLSLRAESPAHGIGAY